MKHSSENKPRLASAFVGAVLLLSIDSLAQPVARQVLPRQLPEAALKVQPIGQLPGTNRLQLAIGLPLRNQTELQAFLRQLYDPAGPDFHHYLTVKQFTERFGPTEKDYHALRTFVTTNHLTITAAYPNRVLLEVSGTVADIEQVFHTTLRTYPHPTEARTFYAPDVAPSLDLAVPVISVGGLNNFSLARPRLQTVTAVGQNAQPNSGSGPGGTYRGNDFRAAYVPGTSLTGSGQIVGLLQFDGYTASDITYYETQAGLPNVPLSNVLLNGATGQPSGSGGEVEVSLDIETSISVAPGLSRVIVYEAPNPSPFEVILNRMVSDNLAKQLSCSWYIPNGTADPTADGIFQEMAAQGQSFYSASGDYDAYTGLIPFPGDTPYITEVGGTTLSTSGPGGGRTSETTWNRGNGIGTGGGISTQYSIPSYQTNISMAANEGSTAKRNVPDVALTAENVYVRANGGDLAVGGTSCAAPLWAGFTALVNQEAVAAGHTTIGFINPAIDTIGSGPNYTSCFFDITTGNNTSSGSPTKFYAVGGYDLCTGWGTPAGQSLIDALAMPEALHISPGAGFSSIGGVGGPFTVTSQQLSLTNAGTNSLTWTLANPVSWLNANPTGGALAPGQASTIVTISLNSTASNLAVGNYSGTLWFTNLTDSNSISRTYSLSIISPPTITSQPTNEAVLEGATASFTVAVTGGMPLYCQWQFNGTNLTNGGNISGSTTTNLVLSDVSSNNIGAYSVVVTNVAGSATSSNANLTITPSVPVIVTQPASQTAIVGETVSFTVTAIGTTPYFYQWSFGGTNIAGATNSVLMLANLQLSQSGTYAVQVSNVLGFAISSNATLNVYAVPVITSFNPPSGTNGEVVNISGLNFDPTPSNNVVYFGAVRAMVSASSSTSLTVTVPVGATFAPITEILHGLSASSATAFLPTFSGRSPLSSSSLGNAFNMSGGSGPFGAVIADIDGDGKPDLVLGNDYEATIWIFRNISTNGGLSAASFAPPVVLQGGTPVAGTDNLIGVAVADLDGDGRLDIVFSGFQTGTVSIFQNLSSPGNLTSNSFGPRLDFAVGSVPVAVTASDLDGDGKPELIVANFSSSTISVLRNLSTGGLLSTNSFATPLTFATPLNVSFVAAGDLDGDGKPDLVTANHSTSTDAVSVFRNTSTVGSISFATRVDLAADASQEEDVTIADIDGDGKPDLIVGADAASNFSVYRNISSPGSLTTNSFAAPVTFAAGGPIHRLGIALADMDGDGRPDVAIVDQNSGQLYLYRNLSTPGTFTNTSLAPPLTFTSGYNSATVALGDLDGDGRPDVFISNTYGNNVTLYQNISPFNGPPVISIEPTNQTAIASNTVTFNVVAGGTQPLAYQWFFNITNALIGATNASLALADVQDTNAGGYSVIVTNVYGSATSSVATLTVIDPPIITNQPASLTNTGGTTAVFMVGVTGTSPFAFQWLKNGTNLTDGGNVSGSTTGTLTLTNVSLNDDANYSVVITNVAGSVTSSVASLTVLAGPTITSQPLGRTNRAGTTATFTITATGTPTLYYQWQKNGIGITDGGNVLGSATPMLTLANVSTNDSANYTVLVTNAYGSALSSNAILAVVPRSTTVPIITSFSPQLGFPGTNVSINGLNFSSAPGSNIVYFGAVQAIVTSQNPTNLSVIAPTNATFAPISVTVNGLTAFSDQPFLPTFPGSTPLTNSSFAPLFNLSTPKGPARTLIADLDGDGKPDLILANNYAGVVSIFQNIGTNNGPLSAASFGPPVNLVMGPTNGGADPFTLAVADLDGDGRLDIVALNADSNIVSIFRNISSPGTITTNSFAGRIDLSAGNTLRGVAVQDLDGDGLPEIVVGNEGDNNISIYKNLSTVGNIAFAPAVNLPTGGDPTTVVIGDLDGDGLPDIAVANYNAGNVAVLRNLGFAGGISTNSFAPPVNFAVPATPFGLVLGDMDGDGKLDIIVGGGINSTTVAVLRNTAAPGSITTNSFASPVDFGLPGWANFLAVADLDGDGKLDIAVVEQLNSVFSVFRNISTPGSFTTASLGPRLDFPSGSNPNGLSVGDLNGDGRPDVVFGNSYDNTLSVYQNISPFGGPPVISVEPSNLTAIAGNTASFNVAATGTQPLAYQWFFNVTNALTGATNALLSLVNVQDTKAGAYSVIITNVYGSATSSVATLAVLDPPTITNQPVSLTNFAGATAVFTVGVSGTSPFAFHWRKNGTNMTDTGNASGTTSNTLTLTNVSLGDQANYSVVITNVAGSTTSSIATLTVLVGPTITSQPLSRTNITTTTATFSVAATGTPTLYYQWQKNGVGMIDGGNISGSATPTLTLTNVSTNDTAIYSVLVTNAYGSALSSNAALTVLPLPNVPVILSFSPASSQPGATVSITGLNFDPAPSNNVVYFGPVRAAVSAASPTNLTVRVPTGATFAPITETVNGLSGYSTAAFLATFPGTAALSSSSLSNSFNLGSQNGPFGVAIGDLDGDGKPDLVVAVDYGAQIWIYRNIGTNGTLAAASFAPPVILPARSPVGGENAHAAVLADLDGDGRLDIVFDDYNNNVVSVYQNLSSPGSLTTNSFGSRLDFPAGSQPGWVAVADLDGDGKPDLIVPNIGSSIVSVLRNISTAGLLTTNSFAAPITFATPAPPSFVAAGDLDGDGKPDLVTANYGTSTTSNAVSVFRNTSTFGSISFAARVDLSAPVGQEETMNIADLDGDGKLDLIAGTYLNSDFSVYRNISSPGSITASSFAPPVTFTAGGPIHRGGIAFGDLDGDGRPDVAIVDQNSGKLYLFRNLSTPGAFTNSSLAAPVTFTSGNNSAGVTIGDLDGDGRPDVFIANTYGHNLTIWKNVVPNYYFVWNSIPSPRFLNTPFAVTIQATQSNGIFTNFSGTVSLTSTNGIAVVPAISGNFTQGTWTGVVEISQTVSNLVLKAADGIGLPGVANPINIVALPSLSTGASGNTFDMTWPVSPSGFILETAPDLSGPWAQVSGTPVQIGSEYLEQVPMNGTNAFYRLRFTGP